MLYTAESFNFMEITLYGLNIFKRFNGQISSLISSGIFVLINAKTSITLTFQFMVLPSLEFYETSKFMVKMKSLHQKISNLTQDLK